MPTPQRRFRPPAEQRQAEMRVTVTDQNANTVVARRVAFTVED